MTEQQLRAALLHTSRRMVELGLNRGTAGNASVRCDDDILITPSALPVAEMDEQDMVRLDKEGSVLQEHDSSFIAQVKQGGDERTTRAVQVARPGVGEEANTVSAMKWKRNKPSSEWRFHCDILKARAEIGAVLHMHSTFATTLACLRLDVPAVHYMIAMAGGDSIRCTPYSIFGEQTLSDHALEALHDRKACLLANHGMIALGKDLDDALSVAMEVEHLCEIYWRTLQAGKPHILTQQQMHEVQEKFAAYKQRS